MLGYTGCNRTGCTDKVVFKRVERALDTASLTIVTASLSALFHALRTLIFSEFGSEETLIKLKGDWHVENTIVRSRDYHRCSPL